jgi:hypothetical protein
MARIPHSGQMGVDLLAHGDGYDHPFLFYFLFFLLNGI